MAFFSFSSVGKPYSHSLARDVGFPRFFLFLWLISVVWSWAAPSKQAWSLPLFFGEEREREKGVCHFSPTYIKGVESITVCHLSSFLALTRLLGKIFMLRHVGMMGGLMSSMIATSWELAIFPTYLGVVIRRCVATMGTYKISANLALFGLLLFLLLLRLFQVPDDDPLAFRPDQHTPWRHGGLCTVLGMRICFR